jgi:site-specific DNA recombinase
MKAEPKPKPGPTLRIYLRRSKAEKEHQQFSLDVQREGCRHFVEQILIHREVTVAWADRVEFVDDDRAGDDFLGRRAFLDLLAVAGMGDVVVCRDQSRLGREALEVTLAVRTLIKERGARLFFYVGGQEVQFANAIDAATTFIGGVGHQMELEAIRGRTKEALRMRVQAGRVAGGRCYGYDLERLADGSGRKYTVAHVNPAEAAIVRRIYQACLNGQGLKRIAIALNNEGIPSPRAGRRGTGSWAPGYARTILTNPRYRGLYMHGRIQRVRRGGKRLSVVAPTKDVLQVEMPEWRIVDDVLWARVQEELRGRRRNVNAPGPAARYALSGIGKCAHCGGSIGVTHTKRNQTTILAYACTWHRGRGNAVCPVSVAQPMVEVDRAVAEYLQVAVLAPENLQRFMAEVRREILAQTEAASRDTAPLEAELRSVRGEQQNLVKAVVASGGDISELVEAMRERTQRIARLEAELAAAARAPKMTEEIIAKIEAAVVAKLHHVHEALAADPAGMREVFAGMFPTGLSFTAVEGRPRRWRISGTAQIAPCILKSDPNGIRTRVHGLKGHCPGPD